MSDLVFDGVSVQVGRVGARETILRDVSLRVGSGEVVGLVGESGSGKSTLARCAVGLMEPSAGRVLLDDVEVSHGRAPDRLRIQMVFQDPHSCLDPRRTIGDSIAEAVGAARRRAGSTRGRPRAADETRRLLGLVGLTGAHGERLPRELSGGQRQRVALARAIGAEPDVILADEVTSALDVSVQGAVLNLLRDLQRELGFGMLFISHNLAVVRLVSDRVAVMKDGAILEEGAVLDVLDRPGHPYTQRLLASVLGW